LNKIKDQKNNLSNQASFEFLQNEKRKAQKGEKFYEKVFHF
jgi:hypothetical protein